MPKSSGSTLPSPPLDLSLGNLIADGRGAKLASTGGIAALPSVAADGVRGRLTMSWRRSASAAQCVPRSACTLRSHNTRSKT